MTKEYPSNSVFISHAWGGLSDEVTQALIRKFKEKNIPYIVDKSHLDYRGSIQEFMIQLGKADMVIIILSNKYLQSEFCMFELIQIYKNDRLRDRIFPIVLDEVAISKSTDRLELVKYWENQIDLLQSKLKELNSLSYIEGITDDLNLYTEIRNNIAKLTSILRDINSLNLRMHSDTDFEILCQGILAKLKPSKAPIPVKPETVIEPKPELLNSIHTSKVWIKWAGLAMVAVFLVLGMGKFIFGNSTKEQAVAIPVKSQIEFAVADSLKLKIESFLRSGDFYYPDKDCAWKAYKQLEKLYPDYSGLPALKNDLVSKLISRTNELLAANSPFEAQLIVQKIHELDPLNKQTREMVDRINRQKEEIAKWPKSESKNKETVSKEINKSNHPVVPESPVVQTKEPPKNEAIKQVPEISPETKSVENANAQKSEHKTRKVTIPANTELVLATNQEFNSEEDLQQNKLYYFRVAKPVLINGVVAVSLNDKAEMKISKIKKSDYKRAGVLEFVITRLVLGDGSGLNLKSSNFQLKADDDIPLIIARGQQFKVKTAQAITIEK